MLIVCNGMYRSGSTLQYNIIKSILELTSRGSSDGFYFAHEIAEDVERFKSIIESESLTVIKTHDSFPEELFQDLLGQIKYVYSYRDLRAVSFSLKQKLGYEIDSIIEMLSDSILIHDHLKNRRNIFVMRYEHFLGQELMLSKEIGSFLEIDISQEDHILIAKKCNIDAAKAVVKKMQFPLLGPIFGRVARVFGRDNFDFDSDTLLHHNHISKTRGDNNAWKSGLTDDEIVAIETTFGEWLKEKGYDVSI